MSTSAARTSHEDAHPANYSTDERRTDWTRYRKCDTCNAKPGQPCLDTRKFTPIAKIRPHYGRFVITRKKVYDRKKVRGDSRRRVERTGRDRAPAKSLPVRELWPRRHGNWKPRTTLSFGQLC